MLLQASINAFICYLLNVMDGTAGYETFAAAKVQQKIDIRKYMPIFLLVVLCGAFFTPHKRRTIFICFLSEFLLLTALKLR